MLWPCSIVTNYKNWVYIKSAVVVEQAEVCPWIYFNVWNIIDSERQKAFPKLLLLRSASMM